MGEAQSGPTRQTEPRGRKAILRQVAERHGVPLSVAPAVLKGELDPDTWARGQRALANLRATEGRLILDETCARSDRSLVLGWADGTQSKATVVSTETYGFTTDAGEHHKLDVLFAFAPKVAKKVKRALKRPRDAQVLPVARKVRERVKISKMVLQRLVDEGHKARFTLTDGTVLSCNVRSFGHYEIQGAVKGAPLTVFRHAVVKIEIPGQVLVG